MRGRTALAALLLGLPILILFLGARLWSLVYFSLAAFAALCLFAVIYYISERKW